MQELEIWKQYELDFTCSGLLVSSFGKVKKLDWCERYN